MDDQDGADVALASFAGRPVVLAMGYTTCKAMCPAILANMMWVEKHLPPDTAGRVRFAFFSFDSEADTPERLRFYADSHGLDLGRWTLCAATTTRCGSSRPRWTFRSAQMTRRASTTPPSFPFSTKRGKSSSSSAGRKRVLTNCSPN